MFPDPYELINAKIVRTDVEFIDKRFLVEKKQLSRFTDL